jgi:hypothetical protein
VNLSQSFPVESEKILAGLEKKINFREKYPPETKQVVWTCYNLSDLLPLFASLSNEPGSLFFDIPPKAKLRPIPLLIRYSDSFTIDLYTDELSKAQTSKLLECLKIGSSAIGKNISKGSEWLVSGNELQFTPESAKEAINLFIELLFDKPDDMNQLVTSIHAEGPFSSIKDFELIINSKLDRGVADIVWLSLSQEAVSDFIKNKGKTPHITNNSKIIPLLILNGESLSCSDSETKAVDFLNDSIKDFEKGIKDLSHRIIFPPLVLSCTWYLDEDTTYEEDCFSLLWKTTEIASLNASINSRLNSMADFVLKKPANLIGLLQQKANLEILKSFPNINQNYPDFAEFTNLCQKGIDKYSIELTHISEPEKISLQEVEVSIPESPEKEVSSVFKEFIQNFLNELDEKDFCTDEQKIFAEAAKSIEPDGSKWNCEKFEKFAEEVDRLLSKIGNHLENKENSIHSELQNLEAHLSSLSVPAVHYTSEEIENLTFFWKGFIPIILKKIKAIKPYDEIKIGCEKTKAEFLNKISLASYDSDEINKGIKKYWRSYAQKIIDQFEDATLIWKLKIDDEMAKIEEFREHSFPREMKIPVSIKFDISHKPEMKRTLNLQIAKPGLFDILVSHQKKEKWHSETMLKISKYVGEVIKHYLKDIMDWILSVENVIDKKFKEIEKIGNDSLQNINEKQEHDKKIIEEASIIKRDIKILERNLKKFELDFKGHKVTVQKWIEIKTEEKIGLY